MKRKQKKTLIRITVSAVIFAVGVTTRELLGERAALLYAAMLLAAYLTVGWDIVWRAVGNITHGEVFDENFLMTIATVGAIFTGEYSEAVFVMIFYQVGELFQSIAVGKSRKSIASLMEIRPDSACVERDGKTVTVDPSEVAVGECVKVCPGEKIPLDGEIIEGTTSINTVALTGESIPCDATVGDMVMNGCINISGVIRIRVCKEFSDSTVSKILELVESSTANKSKSESFIKKFARVYTPFVVIAACLLAVIPPIFIGIGDISVWKSWIYRAMSFLVVSCPCALVISVPMAFFGGIGGLSRCGILVKGSGYIEMLAKCDTVVFDKTGTLTKGSFEVTAVKAVGCSEAELLDTAALCESSSNHPIAHAVCKAAGEYDLSRITEIKELSGYGICAEVDGQSVNVGNIKLMQKVGVTPNIAEELGTQVHVARGGRYLGYIVLSDAVKRDAAQGIAELKTAGVAYTAMLTGDRREVGQSIAEQLGIDECCAELLPGDKVERLEGIMADRKRGTLAFVGDGMNDAPVLARADVGIAMGALGSDAAIEAADIVLMDDSLPKIAQAIRASRRTLAIVKQNVVFVLAVKAITLVFTALGLTGMWAAVFADVGVAVIAILNSMRALRLK